MILSLALMLMTVACGRPSAHVLQFQQEAEAPDGRLKLADVFDDGSLPLWLRNQISSVVLMKLQTREGRISVPTDVLRSKAEALVPLLACYRNFSIGSIGVHVFRSAASMVVRPAVTGSLVKRNDVLELTTSAGPVRVSRRVTAIQDAEPGKRLFVRTGDGALLSVRFESPAR